MAYTLPENISDIRKQAWATRRSKYGSSGHAGSYSRGMNPANQKMLDMIIRLHVEGVLSEGQVAKVTDIGRVEIRRLADEYTLSLPASPAFITKAKEGKE